LTVSEYKERRKHSENSHRTVKVLDLRLLLQI